jgi:ribosomal protein L29
VKVPNSTIDAILGGGMLSIEPKAAVAMIKALAEDLKECRDTARVKLMRVPLPVVAADVSHAIRVETPEQLRMNVAEPYASMVEERARSAAGHVSATPFPLYLVPRTGLWILQLRDKRMPDGSPDTAVCRAKSMEELAELLARERDLEDAKSYRRGGPLENFARARGADCFVNVLESTDTYIAHAVAGLKDAASL